MSKIFVGIDLGGTNIKVGCFDSDLRLICKTAVVTRADMGPDVVVDKICGTTEKLLADNGLSTDAAEAVGIGAPGPSNIAEGFVRKYAKVFKNTISIAIGSLAELDTQIMLSAKLGFTSKSDSDALLERTEVLGKKMTNFYKGIKTR